MWLGKMHNLQELVVKDVGVNASSVAVVLSNMTKLQSLTISNTTMKGRLPKHWPGNLTTMDLSNNLVQGPLPSFSGELQHLESWDLSNNNITGHLPGSLGRLKSLQKLAMARNAMWGPIPDTFVNLTKLTYLDLSNNKLNGSIPDALASLRALRYLDLRNNDLKGILPFNTSFVSKFNTFKVSGNPGLCYDKTITSGKVVPGLPRCDEYGNPVVTGGESGSPASSPGDSFAPLSEPDVAQHSHKSGPKKIVWVVATSLGAILLFILIVVGMSKWCRWRETKE